MTRPIVMLRYRFGNWVNYVNQSDLNRLGIAFERNSLLGDDGQYGFVNCTFHNNVVVGYYTQRGGKEITNYDSSVKLRTESINSFAHILFAIHIPSGIYALQKTRIADFVDLNFTTMRNQFPIAIEDFLRTNNINVIRLFNQQDRVEITSQQLYSIFLEYRSASVDIVNLKSKPIPSYEEFKIFNPRVDEDRIFRQIFGEDIQNGLDDILLQSDENGDLRKSALARLGTKVGDIRSVKVDVNGDGNLIKLRNATSDKFEINISSEDESSKPTQQDVQHISQQLTLTLRLSGTPNSISEFISKTNINLLAKSFIDDEDDD